MIKSQSSSPRLSFPTADGSKLLHQPAPIPKIQVRPFAPQITKSIKPADQMVAQQQQ
ncbi:MAG: hypothetical protein QE269_00915 [Fimbriimonas sp.]|jgi:hypothetical protein|nr:hypothetical protein [Fimbriimonas sp.]